jgi:hypothetical protein
MPVFNSKNSRSSAWERQKMYSSYVSSLSGFLVQNLINFRHALDALVLQAGRSTEKHGMMVLGEQRIESYSS